MDANWKESFLNLYQKTTYEKEKGYFQNVFLNSLIETTHVNEESLDPNDENLISREIYFDKIRRDHHQKDSEAFLKMIKDTNFLPKSKFLNQETKFPSIEELKQQEPFSTIFTKREIFIPKKIEKVEVKIEQKIVKEIIPTRIPEKPIKKIQEEDQEDFFEDSIEEKLKNRKYNNSYQKKPQQIEEEERKGFKSGLEVLKENKHKPLTSSGENKAPPYQYSKSRFDPASSVINHMVIPQNEEFKKEKEPEKKRKFQPPFLKKEGEIEKKEDENKSKKLKIGEKGKEIKTIQDFFDGEIPDEFKNLDVQMVESIHNEILCHSTNVKWDDISGLEFAKKSIFESVIWPLRNKTVFKGIRSPPKGILLFGPPGTGKTLIGKAIANESKATFFNISASSLMSKWIGEGEKLVRTLFAVAKFKQPSVIFIDEIDSLLSQRSEGDSDNGTRRMKTEFLVHLDGAGTTGEDKVLIVGATNRPQEIDEAVRRRLVKKLYIPLPNSVARKSMILTNMKDFKMEMNDEELEKVLKMTESYSGADMKSLCTDACLNPLRELTDPSEIETIDESSIRPIQLKDFIAALDTVKPSVSDKDIKHHEEWNEKFGTFKK